MCRCAMSMLGVCAFALPSPRLRAAALPARSCRCIGYVYQLHCSVCTVQYTVVLTVPIQYIYPDPDQQRYVGCRTPSIVSVCPLSVVQTKLVTSLKALTIISVRPLSVVQELLGTMS